MVREEVHREATNNLYPIALGHELRPQFLTARMLLHLRDGQSRRIRTVEKMTFQLLHHLEQPSTNGVPRAVG